MTFKAYVQVILLWVLVLLGMPFSYAQNLQQDPFIQQELNRSNWEVGGKYQPKDLRGHTVINRGGDAVPQITVLSNQELGGGLAHQDAVITAVYTYSVDMDEYHPYTSHSPFDDPPIHSNQTVTNAAKDTNVTLKISWASVRNHRADAYDGAQGGGYPAPTGARDDYKISINGKAEGVFLVSTTEKQAKDKPPVTRHYTAGKEFFQKAGIDPTKHSLQETTELVRQYIARNSQYIHTGLDIIGLVPVFGDSADALNAALYIIEGDITNAGFSLAAMAPVGGQAAIVAKWGKSAIKDVKPLEALNSLSPQNRTTHELYKDTLRADMQKPYVKNEELYKIINKLYRENASVGSGSTASAVREELLTGKPVGGKWHSQKATDSITTLEKWLKNNPNASSGDRAAAENIIQDTKNALNGK